MPFPLIDMGFRLSLMLFPLKINRLGISKEANKNLKIYLFTGVMMERPALILPIPLETFVSMEFTVLQVKGDFCKGAGSTILKINED